LTTLPIVPYWCSGLLFVSHDLIPFIAPHRVVAIFCEPYSVIRLPLSIIREPSSVDGQRRTDNGEPFTVRRSPWPLSCPTKPLMSWARLVFHGISSRVREQRFHGDLHVLLLHDF
jgi:hypothetical protein